MRMRLVLPACLCALDHGEGADGPSEAVDHQAIDVFLRGDALRNDLARFFNHRGVDAVSHITPSHRVILYDDRVFPAGTRKRGDSLYDVGMRFFGDHDLGEFHHDWGGGPMPDDDVSGPVGRRGKGGKRKARAIRGEDRVVGRKSVEIAEDFDLEGEPFRNAFDDEFGVTDGFFEVRRVV